LHAEALRRLTPDELRLLQLRERGLDWVAIAASVGGTPEALRKRLERALRRICAELDLAGARR
jgi:hypothetical protein